MSAKLAKDNRPVEAKKLQTVLASERERDLVIKLKWGGEADLDLRVQEPIGTLCSAMQKQTTAGGVLIGDDLLQKDYDPNGKGHFETYTAAQAFNGSYKVIVDRVWGQPTGRKATVEVIRHKGTPDEHMEIHTLELDKDSTLTIAFDSGRRKELATTPPPVIATNLSTRKLDKKDETMSKLKEMTDPNFSGFRGGYGVAGADAAPDAFVPEQVVPAVGISYRTRVREAMPGGMEMQVSAVISNNAKDSKMTLTPVFQTASAKADLKLPPFPGSGE
jgi:hypothetical protein